LAYVVSEGDRDWRVKVDSSEGGCPLLYVGERLYRVDAVRPGSSTFSLLVEGRAYEVVVTRREGRHHVQVGGRSYVLEVLEERQKRLRDQRAAEAAAGPASVSASMPGRVVTLLVGEGEKVEAGQGVIVLEAMKMENELKSPKAGLVAEIKVKEGQVTEAGEALIVIE
jgi:biotin carboxyl carrier protein